MPLSGTAKMMSGATVYIGSFFFDPPPKSIEADKTAYVVEHQIPGRDGGLVEYIGASQPGWTLRGVLVSGADFDMQQLLGMKGTTQVFTITSTNTANYFASGTVFVEDMKFVYQEGFGQPYYGFYVKLRNTL